jgi:streptogramin lyase
MISALVLLLFQAGGPVIDNLEIASYQGGLIEIHGHGFGAPVSTSRLFLRSGSRSRVVPSSSPMILFWNDHRIRMALPEDAPSGELYVSNAGGTSASANIEVFTYDWFDIPPTLGTNASPLSIAVDDSQRVWVNQEFQLEFQRLDLSTDLVTGLDTPKPPGSGPFATRIGNDHRTQISVLGEAVMVDPLGRIWFTQGGGALYSGLHENHSRIICVLPDAPGGLEFRV